MILSSYCRFNPKLSAAYMNIELNFTIGDVVATVGLLIASVGLFLNWWQLRKDSIRKRAEFIIENFNQHLADSDTADMFYRLEYGKFEYDAANFHGSPEEIKLDKLLRYFERIATLYEMGTINLEDLALVEYEFLRINHNPSIQNYYAFLDEWSKQSGAQGGNFASVRRVAKLLEEKDKMHRRT